MRPFWLQQALDSTQEAVCPPLQGDARCDVCIVGGGYTGLWTALMLKEAVPAAKAYVEGAMRHGIALGKGHRPLNHFWNVRPD